MEFFSAHLLLWSVFFVPAYVLYKVGAKWRLPKPLYIAATVVSFVAGIPFAFGVLHLVVRTALNILMPH